MYFKLNSYNKTDFSISRKKLFSFLSNVNNNVTVILHKNVESIKNYITSPCEQW